MVGDREGVEELGEVREVGKLAVDTVQWRLPSPLPRHSHVEFFESRNWAGVKRFWSTILTQGQEDVESSSTHPIPSFVAGEGDYRLTDLQALHDVSAGDEFQCDDVKFANRYTYALSLGYDGSQYYGYQQQRGSEAHIRTVEDDLDFLLRRKVLVAGRTDKDVSAVAQIVSFHAHDAVDRSRDILDMVERRIKAFDDCLAAGLDYTSGDDDASAPAQTEAVPELILSKKQRKVQEKKAKQKSKEAMFPFSLPSSKLSGKLRIWDCKRVSRKFHPIFVATWRRYLYLFPANVISTTNVDDNESRCLDVDVEFVNSCFSW
jgi:hypothetical protein